MIELFLSFNHIKLKYSTLEELIIINKIIGSNQLKLIYNSKFNSNEIWGSKDNLFDFLMDMSMFNNVKIN